MSIKFKNLNKTIIKCRKCPRLVKFIKRGNKLLLVQPNLYYRAETENLSEKKSVEQAFAKSVLFGFEIIDKYQDSYK